MQGVTTAIVGFILLALAFPQIIKRSAQYYLAVQALDRAADAEDSQFL